MLKKRNNKIKNGISTLKSPSVRAKKKTVTRIPKEWRKVILTAKEVKQLKLDPQRVLMESRYGPGYKNQ